MTSSKKSKPTRTRKSSESTKARNAPIPASTRVPAQLYAFTPFPDENWEAATPAEPPELLPAVLELRKDFREKVSDQFEKSEQSCLGAADIETIRRSGLSTYDELHYYHNRGHEAQILARHVGGLQKWIAADALAAAMQFRRMAAVNAVSGDPLNWAYGQIRSVLYEFLGLPRGDRLGYWLGQVCDGRPAVNSDLFADPHARVKAQLRRQVLSEVRGYPAFVAVYLNGKPPEWLPAHLLPPRPPSENTREEWPRLDKKMTQEVLEVFVRDFWKDLDAKIIDNMRNIRISLAQLPPEIIPVPTPAGPRAAVAPIMQGAPVNTSSLSLEAQAAQGPGRMDEKAQGPRNIDLRKTKISGIKALNAGISARQICKQMDTAVENAKTDHQRESFAPLQKWIDAAGGMKRTWVALHDNSITYNRIRTFINKVPPAAYEVTKKASGT